MIIIFSLQCYLFAYCTSWRNIKSFLTFGLICLCNMYLYELRNLWQIFFHVTVGAFLTLQIRLRQPQGKAPDYNVWRMSSDSSRQTSSEQYSSQDWKALLYEEKFHVLWDTNKSAVKFFLKEFFFFLKKGLGTNWGTNAIQCWRIYPKDKWEFGGQHEKLHIQNSDNNKNLYWTCSAY